MLDGGACVVPDTAAARTSLAAAATLIEGRVVGIGNDLDTALTILERQTETFDTLSAELGGQDAITAAKNLGNAIMQIERSSHTHAQALATLEALAGQIARLARRADAMGLLAKHATTLALYMRLEGARIMDDGGAFLVFAEDAKHATTRIHAGLLELGAEIGTAASKVGSAAQNHAAFAGSHYATLANAAMRLRTSLAELDDQRRQVQNCGCEVAERSRDMRLQVGQAVQALQIGDTTRQRLEHAHLSIMLLDDALQDGVRVDVGRQIVADQISDAITDFTREVTSVAGAFRAMAADADRIVQLGKAARGDASHADGTTDQSGLLARVRKDTQEVLLTLAARQAARKVSHDAMDAVLACISILRRRVDAIYEMQAKLHIMGLNVALKSGRLGPAGKSIGAITQDMRGCSRRMAAEAAEALTDLAELARIARTVSDDEFKAEAANGKASEIEATRAEMDETPPEQLIAAALSTLSGMEERMDTALSALARDGRTVMTLLYGGASTIAVEAEITRLGHCAMAVLPQERLMHPTPDAAQTPVLSRMFALYTMAREREVHRAALGDQAAADDAVTIAVDIDDLLF